MALPWTTLINKKDVTVIAVISRDFDDKRPVSKAVDISSLFYVSTRPRMK